MAGRNSHGERVKRKILDVGVTLWRDGARCVTARRIATVLGMTHPAVVYHFGNAEGLRDAVARHAVVIGDSQVIAQLIGMKHPAIEKMSDAMRVKHMRAV